MCSRYELNSSAREIMASFDLPEVPALQNQGEIRPTDMGMIIDHDHKATLLPWGFKVDWTKQPMINARAETLTEKPTFQPWLQTRCIVPASGYFEWRTDDHGKKLKNRIWTPDANVFGMAGLLNGEQFTVVTCTSSPAISHIHGRMPVLLSTEDVDHWLSEKSFEEVEGVLKPYEGLMTFDEEKPPPPAQGDLFG